MSKNLAIIVVVFLTLGAGSIAFLASRPSSQSPTVTTETARSDYNQAEDAHENQTPDTPSSSGTYSDYSEVSLASATGDVYLFFHAPWCPQCRAIESDINSQGTPAGITVLKVDYDSNQALRQKYGVTIQTTFVKVSKSGDFIDRYVAYDEPTLQSVKANFFDK